jgi:hypothetical protein
MIWRQHLHDRRLFDCYLADRHGEEPDPANARHLAACRDCTSRLAEIAQFMDGLREHADQTTDALATPERLRLQQQAIARRLDHIGRHARVLSFPSTARTARPGASSHTPRWVAAAAAAGLFVGVALGASYEWELHGHALRPLTSIVNSAEARPAAHVPLAYASAPGTDIAADDAFLSELDALLDRPRTHELLPLDALTPHVREIRDAR